MMDPKFAIINALEGIRSRLAEIHAMVREIENRVLDEWVDEAQRAVAPDAGGEAKLLGHAVAFEGHPAMLLDEPPSRPLP